MQRPVKFDRRRFFEALGALGIAVYAPGCGPDSQNNPPPDGTAKKVLVLGAGLGGLSAAHELVKQGFEVTVLEAQTRVGGRVLTKRDGFAGGQYAEMGAVRIPDVHDYTIEYAQELGLELVEFQGGDAVYYLQGQRFMHESGMPWPVANMTPEETMNGLDMWSTYVKANFAEFGDPRAGTFPAAGIVDKYDSMSWTDYLASKGASEAWLGLYGADNGSEISKISGILWMATEVADQNWDKTLAIKGGNDQIPTKLAEKLGNNILFERVVKSIAHDANGVTVEVDHAGAMETYTADYLVCAIPLKPLRNVGISPALAADKKKAIDEVYVMEVSRGYFQTKTRFWQSDPLGPIGGIKIVKTDIVVERAWDLTNVQDGPSGIIMVYTQNENAKAIAAKPAAEREAFIETELAKALPDLPMEKTFYHEKIWTDDPWVGGGWTDLLPNQWNMLAVLQRSEGRIFFAGEHTSIWAGWMQGAIESGKRVASEIMKLG